jgi:hypothetical protein
LVKLRTCVIAAAVKNAPASVMIAPTDAVEVHSVAPRCGESITITPTKPTTTALQRQSRTVSPRKIAASATLNSGVMKLIAVESASGRRVNPRNKSTIAAIPVKARVKCITGRFILNPEESSRRHA